MTQTKKVPHDSSVTIEDRPCRRCNRDTRHLVTTYHKGGQERKCLVCKKTKRLRGGIS